MIVPGYLVGRIGDQGERQMFLLCAKLVRALSAP